MALFQSCPAPTVRDGVGHGESFGAVRLPDVGVLGEEVEEAVEARAGVAGSDSLHGESV